jgi:hypothetical protein
MTSGQTKPEGTLPPVLPHRSLTGGGRESGNDTKLPIPNVCLLAALEGEADLRADSPEGSRFTEPDESRPVC